MGTCRGRSGGVEVERRPDAAGAMVKKPSTLV
jgi:hypothetical protein